MKLYKLALCGLFTALISIGAFLQIPLPYYDYFTMQTFFVIMSGLLLGPYLAGLSTGAYLLLGLAGLPIFAAGGGIAYILRPSFGFLLGFVLSGVVAGFISHNLSRKNLGTSFARLSVGAVFSLIPTYAVGLIYKYFILKLYLNEPLPFYVLLASCFPIDLPVDILCCILAGYLASRLDSVKLFNLNN